MKCECGSDQVVEVSGRDQRIAALKEIYASAEDKKSMAERIMNEIDSEHIYMCAECFICPSCKIQPPIADCVMCGAPTCHNCSMSAAITEEDGSRTITDGFICCKCSPPSFGLPEEITNVPTRDPVLMC